ncbi:hypothetical protein PHISCL_06866 [Aspergillus sclerotialis]|uniref:DUF7580 domain-containing protein n=1 Tax=Aspergillus sclerotialis TaxID=2070753 RepID=A0A3A2ZHC6_9EURO|nr:hypothetical protein PHISCL_06866 [Aspergillus sclerotialis]
MEAIGVALSLCPLMLNQLDNYVQGLQTLKTFRNRHYRKHLEKYAAVLGGQHAILVNTIGRALGDVVSRDQIRDLLSSPDAMPWKDPLLEDALRERLGYDYEVVAAMMGQASRMLEELASRLDWNTANPAVLPWNDPDIILREARKVKHIISKSIYNDLFDSLDKANNILKTLVDQSVEYQRNQRTLGSERILSKNRAARSVASSVHMALTCDKYWICSCRDRHHIRFILDPQIDANDTSEKLSMFRIIMATQDSDAYGGTSFNWQEVEIEPLHNKVRSQQTQNVSQLNGKAQHGMPPAQGHPSIDLDHGLPSIPLSDLCSALWKQNVAEGQRGKLGYLPEDSYRHNMYLIKKAMGSLPSQSLEEIIMSSSGLPWSIHTVDRPLVRKTRLQLAAKLARSVLHFHGSWLRARWRTSDIRFPEGLQGVQQPFLTWGISGQGDGSTCQKTSSVIRSETLFPLGLALIELSLCRVITALRKPEDENPDEEVTVLKTAHRCLDYVYLESGTRYGDVVQRCLFWSHTRDTELDNDESLAAVFQHIVSPLIEDLIPEYPSSISQQRCNKPGTNKG